jgi:tetratricopeptide (TPR) repeat protein
MITDLALYEEFWSRKHFLSSAGEYSDNMERLAKNEISSIDNLNQSIETQTHALIASQAALSHTMNQGLGQVNNTLQAGFSGISNQLGYMTATMNTGFLNLEASINRMNAEVCDRLDALYNATIRPLLVKTREYYYLAAESYKGGLFDDALDYIKKALDEYKTDYISWFLQGKIYAFGASKHSNVIDLDKAINAFENAVKYNEQYTGKSYEARRMAAEIYYNLGTAQFSKSNDLLRNGKKAKSDEMLEKARASFDQSYQYSDNMLEALFNNARCKVIQGDYDGALSDLETLVPKDRNYCLKVYANPDFADIKEKFDNLIKKLKQDAYSKAKGNYDRLNSLITELKSLGGNSNVKVPSTFTEELPYFDILDYSVFFKRNIPVLEEAIPEQKAYKAKKEAEEKREAEEERRRQWEAKDREEKEMIWREKSRIRHTCFIFSIVCAVLTLAVGILVAIFGDEFIAMSFVLFIPLFLVTFFSDSLWQYICAAANIIITLGVVSSLADCGIGIGLLLAVYVILNIISNALVVYAKKL